MPRPSVLWFAERMEAKLVKNDHKGGWAPGPNWDIGQAYLYLTGETNELEQALFRQVYQGGGDMADVVQECADVANLAMMIAQMVSGMPNGPRGTDNGDCVLISMADLDRLISSLTFNLDRSPMDRYDLGYACGVSAAIEAIKRRAPQR